MIANLVSLFVASLLQHEPIYDALAVQDGIHLPSAKTRQRLGRRQVASIMEPASQLLPAETMLHEALEQVSAGELRSCLVTDRRGVIGVIDLSRLREEPDQKIGELVDALAFPHIHSDQGLDLALERMGANQLDILPVVNRANVHQLEGIVTLRDVLEAYGVNRA
jgi:CIC family chloride channel protein